MHNPLPASIGVLAVLALVWAALAQTGREVYVVPRTPWGDPDLQGQWNSQTSTPLQRPTSGPLANRDTISEEEAETFEASERRSFDDAPRAGTTAGEPASAAPAKAAPAPAARPRTPAQGRHPDLAPAVDGARPGHLRR